jgi:hypothetical protein
VELKAQQLETQPVLHLAKPYQGDGAQKVHSQIKITMGYI